MEKTKDIVNIKKLELAFNKIYQGIEKYQSDELNKELVKMYPTDDSEVMLSAGYDEEENSMGIGIYVSKPKTDKEPDIIPFNQLMFEYLLRTDIEDLGNIMECIDLMERKSGNKYDVDFIPVFYNDELDNYYIHYRITKNI